MTSSSVLAGTEATVQAECEHMIEHNALYQYRPIDNTKGAIRLLILRAGTGRDINCDLIHSTIDEHGLAYEAVSYTWGPEFASDLIKIRGKDLPVTFNLGLILRDLRSPHVDRLIWVDAVCINQQDATEKGHQVVQMKDTFRSAKCVLFCICRPTEHTDFLMDSLKRLEVSLQDTKSGECHDISDSWREIQTLIARQHLNPHQPQFEASLQRQVKALTSLHRQGLEYILNQPWFLRVWILQEVANASSAIVYCGRKSISAVTFALMPQLLDASIPRGQNELVAQVLSLMPGPLRANASQELYPSLQRFRHSLATVERDKIYALYGICQDIHIDTNLAPNYVQSDQDVIRGIISYICRVDVSKLASSHFTSISKFLDEIDQLDNNLFSGLLRAGDHRTALSHLRHRGEYISVTPKILTLASTDIMMKEGLMALLLEHRGADILFSGWAGWHSTCVAAVNGHDALANSMLEKVTDIEAIDSMRATRLFLASEAGNTNLVRLLVEKGANIEANDNYQGMSPLIIATKNGHINTVQVLTNNGAELNSRDRNKRTAITHAAEHGHDVIVSLLLKKGADMLRADIMGISPLAAAASKGHDDTIRILLANYRDADHDDRHSQHDTLILALSGAVRHGHPSTVSLLLEAAVDVKQYELGALLETALSCLSKHKSESSKTASDRIHNQELLVQILTEKGAQSNNASSGAAFIIERMGLTRILG